MKKLKHLLTKTLGWDQEDVSTFKDSNVGIKKIYNKIDNEIKELKIIAKKSSTSTRRS